MDKLIVVLTILAILVGILLIGHLMERNKEKNFRKRLNREFSKPMDRSYSNERMKTARGYYEHHCDDVFSIDDITWNDLGLDSFYQKYNHSYSSVGDEYLYYRLRVPMIRENSEDREMIEREAETFANNPKLREDYQVLMATLGRSGKYSLYTYLEFLGDVKPDIAILTILDWLVYICFIGLIFFAFYPGLMLTIGWIIVNVAAYLFRKKKIEPYFVSFEYILRLLKSANKTIRLLPDSLKEETETLKKAKGKLSRISTGNLVFLQSDTSSAVGDLGNGLMNFIKMFFHIDLFIFYRMKKQVEQNRDAVDTIFETLGRLDYAVNIASYRSTLPYFTKPEFNDSCEIKIQDAVHPLLLNVGIENSVHASKGILLTGSNASGKSTFLRMIGINALLAQSMYTVYAKEYRAGYFRIYSSMSLKDSLESGESYYMAEIRSIKRILDALSDTSTNVLCFVDEVLRGTNTKERIAAGAEIMRSAQTGHSLCFAATHDIELAHMLPPQFENYHFEEEIQEDDIHFPYRLKEGYATSRNAIALLRIMGYPQEITDRASEYVQSNS